MLSEESRCLPRSTVSDAFGTTLAGVTVNVSEIGRETPGCHTKMLESAIAVQFSVISILIAFSRVRFLRRTTTDLRSSRFEGR